jgi:hypothetical protein
MPLLSANIVVCESALTEKSGMVSAIRMMDTITLAPGNTIARFYIVTRLSCQSGDFSQHVLKIQVTHQNEALIVEAPEHPFRYGYKMDIDGPGGFILTTETAVDTVSFSMPARCVVTAFLDGRPVARTPLMLRR